MRRCHVVFDSCTAVPKTPNPKRRCSKTPKPEARNHGLPRAWSSSSSMTSRTFQKQVVVRLLLTPLLSGLAFVLLLSPPFRSPARRTLCRSPGQSSCRVPPRLLPPCCACASPDLLLWVIALSVNSGLERCTFLTLMAATRLPR